MDSGTLRGKWLKAPVWVRRLLRNFSLPLAAWLLLNLIFPLKFTTSYSPLLYDRHGALLYTRLTPDEKWRLPLQPDEITPLMEKTILAKEDRWFYYHPGINPVSIARALVRNTTAGRRTSGASTITMQVARMLHRRPRTWGSKLIEMFRALQLEIRYSKKEILRLYLNLAPYGGNMEGIASASYFYFDKAPDHLSLAEITALSIIPNRPNSLTPGKHNDAIVKERNRWLQWMATKDIFTKKEIEDALREPFDAYRHPAPRLAPHLTQRLRVGDGATVTTTLSLNTQLQAEKITGDYVRSLQHLNIRNAAAIIMENATGKVVAYVGSANFFDTTDGGQVNGAAAIRQPGSTLKPLVYGLGIDAGLVTPKRMIADVPVNYNGYVPENYDLRFNGLVSMEYALMHSLNIPAVNMLQAVGKDKMIQALTLSQFKQIIKDRDKLGLSLILGGCGTSLEDLTGMYSMIANNGFYKPLRFTDADSLQTGARILSKEASFILHETLSKIDRPDLPLNWTATESLPRIAWKTGTSYGRRDAWSIGYNKTYTIGVWVGNFSGKGSPDLSGATIATPLLFRLFNAIDKESHTDWFTPPDGMEQRKVCAETGLVPNDYCEQIVLDYFIPLTSSTQVCNNRQEIMISPDEKISFCNDCAPDDGYKQKWYTVLPPEVQAFNIQAGPSNTPVPPHNPACTTVWPDKGPIIKSPQHRAEYLISKQHPEPLLLECQPANDVAMVHWYINNKHYKTAPARDRVFFMPNEGQVKISCTDDKGRNRDVMIDVRLVDL